MKRITRLGALVLAAGAMAAHADVITISTKTQTFANPDCAKTASCDLKDFVLRQEDYKGTIPSKNMLFFGTRMHAVYDTASLDTLEQYGIVQFIRGCVYDSRVVNGTVVRDYENIEHYGQLVPFHFPQDVIDGFVPDPIDWGAEPNMPTRHFFYLNKFVGSNEPGPKDYYGIQKPSTPRLYLRDMPGTAQVFSDGSAKNLSLQFRICVYKTADVPKSVPDSKIDFATPLQCFGWNSSFVYNFDTKQFDRPDGIVDFCK